MFADANYDVTKIKPSDYQTFATAFTKPEVKTALSHITSYMIQVCGITTTT